MLNLQVNFSCAWLLLLIVPAVLLTLLPYFKLSKNSEKQETEFPPSCCT